jgi:phosphonate metabolism protein (transferase hexapeptide repeat family)
MYVESHGTTDGRELGPEPTIHDPVTITESELGEWTELHEGCRLHESAIGDYTYLMARVQLDHADVGAFCSVASDVRLGPTNHPIERPTAHHFTYRSGRYDLADADDGGGADGHHAGRDDAVFEWRADQPVAVGHDVWIGHGATVLPNVEIGNGAVVGAGSVVAHDVAPYEIVAGVPAESIRRRFDAETVARIESTEWWEWDHDTLAERLSAFRDLETFLAEYAPSAEAVAVENRDHTTNNR